MSDPLPAFTTAWTVLSRLLLRPPTQLDLDTVRSPDLLAVWPLDHDAATAEGLALLRASAEEEDAEMVRADFNRLFVGPARLLAHPWESVHRSEEHLLFDEQTAQVRTWYARYALAVPRLNQAPDDHIGLELEFLAHLGQRALADPEHASDVIADLAAFLSEHPAVWAPGFADLVSSRAEGPFYQGVGRLLTGTITQSVAAFVRT